MFVALCTFSAANSSPLLPLFNQINEWIMTLNVGSNNLSRPSSETCTSIYINGNLARSLLASYRLTSNLTHLEEGLRWCDTFSGLQVEMPTQDGTAIGGFWGVGYGPGQSNKSNWGDLYLGDTGTAVTTLALGHHLTTNQTRKDRYKDKLKKYWKFITRGCKEAGCGLAARGNASAPGFIDSSGALGCGYYKGHLSALPYVIATGTTGAAFGAELNRIQPSPALEKMVTGSMTWIAETAVNVDGSISYILDGKNDMATWPLDTTSYVTEGLIAAAIHLPTLQPMLRKSFRRTVKWLIDTQNADGSWGILQSQDQQRSPRVVSLLQWWQQDGERDLDASTAIQKYFAFLSNATQRAAYGVFNLTRTTGFLALAVADKIQFGVTYSQPGSVGTTHMH